MDRGKMLFCLFLFGVVLMNPEIEKLFTKKELETIRRYSAITRAMRRAKAKKTEAVKP